MKKLITCLFILLSVHIYSQSGAALSFNGTGSQVDLGNSINTVLTALNTITVEAWVYPTSTSSLGVICGNYDNPTAPEMQFLLRRDADTYTFWVDDGSSFKNVSSSPASVTLNTWQHVAGVWDGAQLYIYINGVLQSTTTGVTGSNFLATSNDIIIGNDASGESFAGSIDELRIWSRPLCANDITNGMSCEIPVSTDGLLADYHFNEGTASGSNSGVITLTDASGNGYDGTLSDFDLTGSASNWIAPGGVATGTNCGPFSYPAINSNPVDQSICSGINTSFSVTASGTSLSYQWQVNTGSGYANVVNTSVYSNATSAALTVTNPDASLNGNTYQCIVSGCGPSVTSTAATLTVKISPTVSITGTTTICSGTNTTLTGNGADTYSWNMDPSAPLDKLATYQLAVGLRKLRTAYSGNALRLRRSSDNVEADFGFTGTDLDLASINTFLGTNQGYCTVLYDQSGMGNDMTQTDQTRQPLFIATGLNGKPILRCASSSSQTLITNTNFQPPYTVVYGAIQNGPIRGRMLNAVNDNWLLGWWGGAKDQAFYEGWVSNSGSPLADNNPYVYSGAGDGVANSYLYGNGTLIATNAGGLAGPNGLSIVGYNNTTSEWSDGDFAEAFVFNTVLSDADRQLVESSTGIYYNIFSSSVNTVTNTVSPPASTTYLLTGTTTANGCSSTVPQLITVNITPSSTITGVSSICNGNRTTLSAQGTGTYSWSPGGATSSTLVASTSGTYSLTVSNGSCSASSTTMVNIYSSTASLDFDGYSTYVDIGTVIPNNSSYTKEAWIYPTAYSAGNIITSNNSPFWLNGGNLAVANGFAGTNTQVTDAATIPLNTWTHVAATYDASSTNLTLYVNGIVVGTMSGASPYVAEDMTLGQFAGGNYFQGNMDEVRIWNYARAQSDIQANMNQTLGAGTQAGLLAYYTMNDGIPFADNTTLLVLPDASGNNNAGTYYNFPLTGATSNFVNDFQTTTITGISTVCVGSPTILTVSGIGANTYSWNPGTSTTDTAIMSPVINTSYTATTIDMSGCSQQAYYLVLTNPAPAATGTHVNVNCYGGSTGSATIAVTSGTPNYTYSWSPGGATSASINSLTSGDYTCTISDANGCSTTTNVTVTQPAVPFVASNLNQLNNVCKGGFDGYIEVTESGGTPCDTYSWSNGLFGQGIYGQPAGTYTCTVTDSHGCHASLVATLTEPPTAITSSLVSQTNLPCNGASTGTATITASGGTGTLTYSWNPGGETTTSVNGLTGGSYTCNITDANGCMDTTSVTITQPPPVSIPLSFTSTGACNGGADTLKASGLTSYIWSPASGLNTTSGTQVIATVTADATYTVTGSDISGCPGSNTISIALNPDPVTPVITANINVLTASGTGVLFQWYLDGNPISGASSQIDTAKVNGNYTVVETNGYGCSSTSTPYSFTITDVNGLSTSTAIKLYPNPSPGDVTLELNNTGQHTELDLYDMLGQQIKTVLITGNITSIHHNELAEGIYSYRIVRDHIIIGTGRLVMQR